MVEFYQQEEITPKNEVTNSKLNLVQLLHDQQDQLDEDRDPVGGAEKSSGRDHLIVDNLWAQAAKPADPPPEAKSMEVTPASPEDGSALPKDASKEVGKTLDPVSGFLYQILHLESAQNSIGTATPGVPIGQRTDWK